MPPTTPRLGGRTWRWVLAIFAAVMLLVVTSVLVWNFAGDEEQPSDVHPTSVQPTENAQLEVAGSATLTVPDTLRMESDAFEAEAGDTYLLEFEATAEKPSDSPGDAMYFGANLACGGPDGGTLRSVGGTQNVLTGEEVTIRNQFLLTIEDSGSHACRLSLNSPNEDAAASGTDAPMTTHWSASRVEATALEASADERLPRVVDADDRAAAFRFEVDLEDLPSRELDLLGTLHLTTCTGVNGSREDGTTWCEEDDVDPAGSDIEVTYRTDVLDASDEVCERRVNSTTSTHITRFTHHRVLQADHPASEPLSSCGDTAQVVVAVENAGPAPVVIHRSNSTLLLLSKT